MTFLGWLSDLFKGLSDLQLGDKGVTLNHLGEKNLTIFRANIRHPQKFKGLAIGGVSPVLLGG